MSSPLDSEPTQLHRPLAHHSQQSAIAAWHQPQANSPPPRNASLFPLIALKALLSGAVLVLIVWVFSGNRLQQVSTSPPSPKARETLDGTGVNGDVLNNYQTLLDPSANKKTRLGSNHGQTNNQATLLCLTNHPEIRSLVDPSNYGIRLAFDWQMRPVANRPTLIVLHETVVDENTAMALFRSPHNNNSNQSSYHILIGRDGRRIRLVPDSERAYGAGDSDFAGMAVQLKPGLPPSLNNIALHVSLVSPPDGADGELREHSGYTETQYSSLASQIARWKLLYGISPGLVLTHQEVDRSGSRRDPRSFNWGKLSEELRSHWVACGGSPINAALGRSGGRT